LVAACSAVVGLVLLRVLHDDAVADEHVVMVVPVPFEDDRDP